MFRTLRAIVLPALTGLALLALVGLAGSTLFLYREAAAAHPALGWLVIALIAAAIGLLIVYPVVRMLRLPGSVTHPGVTEGPAYEKFLRRYVRRLADNAILREEHPGHAELVAAAGGRGSRAAGAGGATTGSGAAAASVPPERLETLASDAIAVLDRRANEIIARHAAAVFTSTAVSQSGRLDAMIVISAQLRMVKEIAEVYYQRPNPRELWRLYANVGTSAFVAGEIQDSEILAVLGAPVTAGITGFIPVAGADPLVNLLVRSLLDGSTNAFLTLRIGILARRYCGVRLEESKRLMARSASLEAAGLLGGVVSRGASRLAGLTRQLILGRAVKGSAKAAKDVADAGASLFEKIIGLAGRAGTKAVDTTAGGLKFLQESLTFWETVATKVEEVPGGGPGAAGSAGEPADLRP